MTRSSKFTLLEVLAAMVILAVGVSALLYQMGSAANRAQRNEDQWEESHELAQAAEYLLLHGEAQGLDPELFSGRYQIRYQYQTPELTPEQQQIRVQGKTLRKLILTLEEDHAETARWELECWSQDGELRK